MADDLLIRVDAQISQFEAAFGKATGSTIKFETALKRASAQQQLLESQINKYGASSAQASAAQARAAAANARLVELQTAKIEAQRVAMTRLGTTAGKIGLIAAIGFGLAAKASADFEQSMSRVEATGDDARQNLDQLRQAAIDLGQSTKFSATESADAITELIKAGVSAQDVLGGALKGSLDLAAAGELEVADAANIAATAMTQFGLAGEAVPHIADLLAAAAGKAQGEVTDMAQALKYVGPVAAQMGVSIEETVGTVAELANQGILANQAGTSLRGILSSLTSPSAQAAEEMKKLGINMYDASGQFIGFEGVAGQLQETMGGLTNAERDQALGRIFGNQQITAARVLYAGGAEDVAKWTAAVNDQGFAADTAATKMDNLIGDLEKLRGALETALIGTGDSSAGPLREMVQAITELVDAYNSLPAPVKAALNGLLAVTAVAGATVFAVTRIIGAGVALKANLQAVGLTAGKTATALKGLGAATAAVAILYAVAEAAKAVERSTDRAVPGVEELTKHLLALSDAQGFATIVSDIGDLGAALDTAQDPGFLADVDALYGKIPKLGGILQETVPVFLGFGAAADQSQQQVREAADAITSLDEALANIVTTGSPEQAKETLDQLAAAYGLNADQVSTLTGMMPLYEEALAGASVQETLTGEGASAMGADVDAAGAGINRAASAARELSNALERLQGILDNRATLRDYEAALDATTKALKENGRTLDIGTEKGRNNQAALDAQAGAAIAFADTMKDVGKQRKFLQGARDDLIDMAEKFDTGRLSARQYVDQILDIPSKAETTVKADTDAAVRDILGVAQDLFNLDGRTATVHINAITAITETVRQIITGPFGGASPKPRSSGGYTGDGGKYEPKGVVHGGEFVFDKASTSRIGTDTLYAVMRGARGYAEGGAVGGAFTKADLLRLLARPEHTVTLGQVNKLMRERAAEEEKLGPLLKDQKRAREALNRVEHQENATKKEQAAAAKRLEEAEKAVTKQRDELAEATDREREARQKLLDQTKAYVQQIQDLADPFGGEGTSLTAQGLLAKKRAVASDAAEFRTLLGIIKRKGADRDVLDQLRSQGSTQDALALVRDLARQPRSYFKALNRADNSVGREGRALGTFGSGGGTSIGRQVNIHQHGVHLGPTFRQIKKATRDAAEHGMIIAGNP